MTKQALVHIQNVVVGEQDDESVLLPEMLEMHGTYIEVYDEDAVCELMEADVDEEAFN